MGLVSKKYSVGLQPGKCLIYQYISYFGLVCILYLVSSLQITRQKTYVPRPLSDDFCSILFYSALRKRRKCTTVFTGFPPNLKSAYVKLNEFLNF